MKKYFVGVVAIIAAIIMSVCLMACSTSVAGNTYTFKDVEVSIEGDVPAEFQDTIDEMLESFKENFKMEGMTMTFNADGTATTNLEGAEGEKGYYKQEGNKVYMLESADAEVTDKTQYMTVEGNNLVMSNEQSYLGMTIKAKIIFSK